MLKYVSPLCLSFALSAQAAEPVEVNQPNKLSISTGLGIPYGILGVTLNYRTSSAAEYFGGIGSWGPSYGVRFFPSDQTPTFHLSLFYAPNVFASSCYSCDDIEEVYSGLNASLGFSPEAGQDGWEIDAVLILTSAAYEEADYEEEGSNVKIAFGYRWAF